MELTVNATKNWMDIFSKKIAANKEYLSELDTAIGDGDHGNNMDRGMTAVMESLDKIQTDDLSQVLKSIAMALISKVGGASGPLYGTAFLEMAKESKTSTDLSDLLTAGLAGIKKRGGATIGDKTMVDVWEEVIAEPDTLDTDKIKQAVDSTKELVAKKGRASYLGERSVGHIDPGACSSGYLFEALLEMETKK